MKFIAYILLPLGLSAVAYSQNTYPWPANDSVGIGTANPQAPLHVAGTTIIETDYDAPLTFNTNDNYWQYIQFKKSGVRTLWMGNDIDNNFNIYKASSGSILLMGADVGIGTATPQKRLHVAGQGMFLTGTNELYINEGGVTDITRAGFRNNAGSLVVNAKAGGILYFNRDVAADTRIQSNELDIAIFKGDGTVGIGTIDPKGYRLAVNGDAIFTRAKVKAYANWPDYVFDPSYALRPLREVQKFITQHRHLPDMPSASEVEKNGLDLGDNQALLLKKIEELTLYLLDQQKQIDELKSELIRLKKQK